MVKISSYRFLLAFCILFLVAFSVNGQVLKSRKRKVLTQEEQMQNTATFINANKEKLLGNFNNAINLFQKCIHKDPYNAAAHYELARIYYTQNKYPEAIRYAKKAVEIDEKNIWFQLLLGEIYIQNKQFSEALAVYKNVTKYFPQNLEIKYEYATLLLQAGKYAEAITQYDEIEKNIGITEDISIQKHKIYLSLNKTTKAKEELEKLIAAFPNEARYYAMLADLYMYLKQPDKAFENYQKVAQIDPSDGTVHIYLADYYRNIGNREKSFEELSLAFKSESVPVKTKISVLYSYFTLTEKYTELKEQAYALADLFVQANPDEPVAFSILGDFYYRDKKLPEAIEQYKKVLALDSSKYAVWEQLLMLTTEVKDFISSLSYSQKAIELFPEQPLPYLFNGIAKYQLNLLHEAIDVLNKGLDIVVDNKNLTSQFYTNIGDSYYKLKDYKNAYHAFENALKFDSRNTYVLNNYSYYLALNGDSLEKAEKMSKLAVDIAPNSSSYLDTYGWVLFKLQKYNEAKQYIFNAIEKGGNNNAVILEHYGDVLFKLNEFDNAFEYWKKALEVGKGSEFLERKATEKKYFE